MTEIDQQKKHLLLEKCKKFPYVYKYIALLAALNILATTAIYTTREISQFFADDDFKQVFDDGEFTPGEKLPENWVKIAYEIINIINDRQHLDSDNNILDQVILITASSKRYPESNAVSINFLDIGSSSNTMFLPEVTAMSDEYISIENKCITTTTDIASLQGILEALNGEQGMSIDSSNLTGEIWQERILDIYEDDNHEVQMRSVNSYTILDNTAHDYPQGRLKVSKTTFSTTPENPIFMIEQHSDKTENWAKSTPEVEHYAEFVFKQIEAVTNGPLCDAPNH